MAIFGTIMVLVAVFDVAWGLTTVAIGSQLQLVAEQLDDNKIGMALGGFVHSLTLGVFSLSGVETGAHARELLATLARPAYLAEVGWTRVGLSLIGCVFGVLLVTRVRGAMVCSLVWAVVILIWTIWVTIRIWAVATNALGDPMQGEGLPMFVVEMVLHFLWPATLATRLTVAISRREAAGWR
jgi:hypothetical protein